MTDYLNPARTSANIALSVNNSVATRGAAADAWCATFGLDTQATTYGYFEVVVGTLGGKDVIGVGNASAVTTTYCGGNANGVGLHSNGSLYYSGGTVAPWTSYAAGDVLGFAIDSNLNKIWISKNGTWMSGNPNTGTGGYGFAVTGALTPGISLYHSGDGATLRVLASEFSEAIPTGFSAWEAAGSTSAVAVIAATSRRATASVVATGYQSTTASAVVAATSRRSTASAAVLAQSPTTPSVSVSDTTARVGFAAAVASTVAIQYSVNADLSGSTTTSGVAVTSASDFTGSIDLGSLTPGTTYYYTPTYNGVAQYSSSFPSFKTFPASGVAAPFSFAFGSCTRHNGSIPADILFAQVPSTVSFLMHIGDLIYADYDAPGTVPAADLADFRIKHRDTLSGQNSTTEGWAALRAKTPIYTIWDDHDLTDNFSAGPTSPIFAPAFQAFQEYGARANPDGPTSGQLYYSFQYGNVGFFVLDGRSFRSPNANTDNASKTILGSTQLADLESWLLGNNSALSIKFVVTGTSASGYGDTGNDSWGGNYDGLQTPNGANGFRTERNALWDFIDANAIQGVVFLSGDQHWAGSFRTNYASRPRYEFMSSPFNNTNLTPPYGLAANPTAGPMFWSYDNDKNVGVVTVDPTVTPATVSYQLYNTAGSKGAAYSTSITADQINSSFPAAVATATSRRSTAAATAAGTGTAPSAAVIGATARKSTAAASAKVKATAAASAQSRRASASVTATGSGATPSVAVIAATSRRATASAVAKIIAEATAGAKSRRSTAHGVATGSGVAPTVAVAAAVSRRASAHGVADNTTLAKGIATSRRTQAAVVATVSQHAVSVVAATSRRSTAHGNAAGFANTLTVGPGRTALFAAELRTATFTD